MNNNPEIWAVQDSPKDLKRALNKITTDSDLIIFTNLLSRLQIGHQTVFSRKFDTALYSEDNNILIMLMKNGVSSVEEMRDILDSKNLNFNEVCFSKCYQPKESNDNIPEVLFIRNSSFLNSAFASSNSSNKICEYYPNLIGRLYLDYFATHIKETIILDKIFFKGVVRLEDKVLLLIDDKYHNTVNPADVIKTAGKYNFICTIRRDLDFELSSNSLVKKKTI